MYKLIEHIQELSVQVPQAYITQELAKFRDVVVVALQGVHHTSTTYCELTCWFCCISSVQYESHKEQLSLQLHINLNGGIQK